MKTPILMPILSDTMETGHLVRWLKKPGDKVKKGEAIAEVDSDKATMEIEAEVEGYLTGPLTEEGKEIPVKQVIGYIADTKDTTTSPTRPASSAKPKKKKAEKVAAPKQGPSTPPVAPEKSSEPVEPRPPKVSAPAPRKAPGSSAGKSVSPYARALAADLSLDIARISPGRDGQIRSAEVIAAAIAQFAPAAELNTGPPYEIKAHSPIRKAVAQNMIQTIYTPTFRISLRVSLTPLRALSEKKGLSFTLLLARACALNIAQHPLFNAAYTPEGIAQRQQVDIGIAVDTGDGLITPVLRDVAKRPLNELAEDWRILKDKAKRKHLLPEQYRGATFYISNLGVFPEIVYFDAVVPLGAAAILAVTAESGEGALLTLTCDHRVIFGADAARFFSTLNKILTEPGKRNNW